MKLFLKIARPLLAVSLALALWPAPLRAQATGPQYTVQAGDTMFDIAQRFGLSLAVLQAANPGLNPDALAVGQALVIPGFDGVSGTLSTHRLEPGESLDSLALRFGLRRETLIRLNRVLNPDLLYINQAIVVVDQLDGGPPVSTGQAHTAQPDWGLLATAAALNQNPWALARVNRLAHASALRPGALLVAPGGEAAPSALPSPLRAMSVRPIPPVQGHTASIRIEAAEPLSITGALGDWPLSFATGDDGTWYALVGIYRLADPNLYRLTLIAESAAGRTVEFSQYVPVRAGNYLIDPPLTVNPSTLDPAVVEPETERVRAIVAGFTPTPYWNGMFALPSVGALRSLFGSLRSYNGGPYDSFHGGVDFSGAEDRPITAPAPGVVVLAEPLTVRGNATIIDHGWGVYTGYWHQSRIEVQAGQRVETGQILGYQGATGRVTGPHLHWEMWVAGVQVDPLEWTETEFP
jgi:murein DD-endopeptidase MepM/ murein hydrolase activator NlpD